MSGLRYYLALVALFCTLSLSAQTEQETVVAEDSSTAVTDMVPLVEAEPATSATLWDAANTAYINGDYAAAISAYEQILASGEHSAKLYYNLGNAYYKSDEIGRAILFYHRALRLQPGDEDIRHNLSVAEARTKDTIERIPSFFLAQWFDGVRHLMGSTAWSILSLVALVLMGLALLAYLLGGRLSMRKAGFYAMLFALFVVVVTAWFALSARSEQLAENRAIVMSSSAAVKSSPDRAATDLFILHEGTEVEITNRHEGWCEVVIADGKKGWTESQKIEVI